MRAKKVVRSDQTVIYFDELTGEICTYVGNIKQEKLKGSQAEFFSIFQDIEYERKVLNNDFIADLVNPSRLLVVSRRHWTGTHMEIWAF